MQELSLNYLQEGVGPPVILLHGLLGSLKNLTGLARALSDDFSVCRIDLPAHGQSSGLEDMTFSGMANAVAETVDSLGWQEFAVLGHSLGGKVAMQLASERPSRVKALIVEDIAPVRYPPHHKEIIEALCAIDLDTLGSRAEADELITHAVPDRLTRSFLLQNLKRNEGRYQWAPDLALIKSAYPEMCEAPNLKDAYDGPTLFVAGERSNYIQSEHQSEIEKRFPNAKYRQISGAGHWIHAEKPSSFNALARRFLIKNS